MLARLTTLTAGEAGLVLGHLSVLFLLSLFGLHRLIQVARARRGAPRPAPPDLEDPPSVTVQLPLMNERYVAVRLLQSVAALDYPRDRLEVQVLDDSTDDTPELLGPAIGELRSSGLRIEHLRRKERLGFKAGALQEGLRRARGELLLILDADFLAPPDFLLRTVPHFADPRVGLVQARWDHQNAETSWLTRAQALMLDGHFCVEHRGRHAAGLFFNFNGTAGVFRRSSIEAAGGWQHDTLTEDLDLSYRMQLAGYRAVYQDEVAAPGELPSAIGALKSQQHRWAKGSLQTARKLLGPIWRSRLPLPTKIEATAHLTGNLAYLLLLLLSLLSVPSLLIRHSHGMPHLAILDLAALGLGLGSLLAFYGEAASRLGHPARLRQLPALMALGIGLAVNNSLAVAGGLLGLRSPFVRTPKRGDLPANAAVPRAYRPRRDVLFVLELGLATWLLWGISLSIEHRIVPALPFLVLLFAGHAWVGLTSLLAFTHRSPSSLSRASVCWNSTRSPITWKTTSPSDAR